MPVHEHCTEGLTRSEGRERAIRDRNGDGDEDGARTGTGTETRTAAGVGTGTGVEMRTGTIMEREGGENESSGIRHIGKEEEKKTRHCHSARGIISVDKRWRL